MMRTALLTTLILASAGVAKATDDPVPGQAEADVPERWTLNLEPVSQAEIDTAVLIDASPVAASSDVAPVELDAAVSPDAVMRELNPYAGPKYIRPNTSARRKPRSDTPIQDYLIRVGQGIHADIDRERRREEKLSHDIHD